MRIEELLGKLRGEDPEAIREIAKNLNVHPPIAHCTLGFLIPLIAKALTDFSLLEKFRVPSSAIDSLEAFVVKDEPIPHEHKRALQKYGFVICDVVPDEVFEHLRSIWLPKYILELPTRFDPIASSAFLTMNQSLAHLEQNGEIKLHNKRGGKMQKAHCDKINEKLMVWKHRDLLIEIVEYLSKSKLVEWNKNVVTPNISNIARWRKADGHRAFKHFYEEMFSQLRFYWLGDLIGDISQAGAVEQKWVSSKLFKKERLKSASGGLKLGLVRAMRNEEDILLQLTPEGSFYSTGQKPTAWRENNMLISADFDLHIPSNHDPFVIWDLYSECELVNNEAFVVFKVEPSKISNKRSFLDLLEKYCRRIPDVVRYEFEV